MMGEIFRLFGTIGVDTTEAERGIDSVTGKAKKSGQGIFGAFTSLAKGIGKIAAGIGLFKLVDKGINMITSSIGGAIARVDTLNTFPGLLVQMGYTAEEAERSISRLGDGIDGLPTTLDGIVGSTQRMITILGDVDLGTESTLALNNAFLASSATSEDAARGLEQYMQMLSAGKVDMQSWKTLQETMPYALQETAKAFGFTGRSAQKDFYEALKEGDVTMDQFNSKIIELSNAQGGFAEIALNASGGIATSWKNVKTAITNGVAGAITAFDEFLQSKGLGGISGVLDKMKEAVKGAFKTVNTMVPVALEWFAKLMSQIRDSKAWDSLKGAINTTRDSLSNLWSKMQESGIIDRVKGYVEKLWNALLEIDFQKIISDIATFIDRWGPLIAGIMGGIVAFKALTAIIPIVVAAFKTFTILKTLISTLGLLKTGALLLAPVIGAISWPVVAVAAAIGALIAIGVLLWKNWDTIKAKTVEIWGFIVDAVTNFLAKAEQVFTDVMDKVLNIMTTAWNFVRELWISVLSALMDNTSESFAKVMQHVETAMDAIWTVIETVWNYVKETFLNVLAFLKALITGDFSTIKDIVKNQLELMKETIGVLWEQVKTIFTSVVGAIKDFVLGKFEEVKNKLGEIWDRITENVETAWEFIKNVIEFGILFIAELFNAAFQLLTLPFMFIWENIKEYVFAAWEWIKTVIDEKFTQIKDFILKVLGIIVGYFTTKWNEVKKITETVFNAVSKFINTVWTAIKTFFTMIISAIVKWIIDRFNNLKRNITTIFTAVKAFITTVWNSIKAFIMPIITTIVNFVKKSFENLKNNVTRIFNLVKSVITNVWNAIRNTISTVVSAILSVITSRFNAVRNTVTNVFNAIRNVATTVWNAIKNVISNVVNGIKNTVTNVFNNLRTSVSNTFNRIKDAIIKPVEKARDAVKRAIDKIKSAFNFSWSLPKLKVPKVSIDGSFSLSPPSVPKFGIDWFADGGILTKAMAFGMNGNNVMVGGEAGREAVLPLNARTLGGIGDGIAATMNFGNAQIIALLEEIKRTNEQVVMQLVELLSRNETVVIQIDGQTIAMVTRDHMDKELGDKSRDSEFGKGRS